MSSRQMVRLRVTSLKSQSQLLVSARLRLTMCRIVRMQTLLDKAKEVGYEQIELEVVSKNERAIALYEKMGFVKTGTLLKALKNKDGSYYDLTLMMREL